MLWFYYLFLLLLLNSGLELNLITKVHSLSRNEFPPDFVFGSGTSAYQWEGAVDEDGRTPSIWDTFARAGKMHGATGDIACDGYHKYKEDVQLMVDVGLEAFRFSISWSRLIPNGRGPINPKGLQFYNNFINELISHGIQPHVTLHHSDFPQALESEYGGFSSRKIIKDFTAYADVCFREFGDRIKYWTTFNEANVFVLGGYDFGILPPSRCSSPFGFNCSIGNSSTEPYIATHHILLSHASAANLYKKNYQAKQQGFIGINLYVFWLIPLTDSLTDQEATQRANDFLVGWYLNPLVYGDYPKTMKKNAGSTIPAFTSVESKFVKGSIDFIGVNFYHTMYVKDQPSSLQKGDRDFMADMGADFIHFTNDSSRFPVTRCGLEGVLGYIKQHYGNPCIYIHENGKNTSRNSSTEDWPRVKYMHAYIGCLLDSIRNGSNVQGYFQWSFMDVFELLDGYKTSFGLYYVDLDDPDLKRQPKLSAHWYSNFLKRKNNSSDAAIMSLSSNDCCPL